jgi:hypothetical protein
MKAISIRQPWAWLILAAGKDIENRDWKTRYRGPILIHASAGMTKDEYAEAIQTARLARRVLGAMPGLVMPAFADLQRGGIVGQVEIVDCVSHSVSPWFFGTYGFVLKNPVALQFRPLKGALGIFDVPDQP